MDEVQEGKQDREGVPGPVISEPPGSVPGTGESGRRAAEVKAIMAPMSPLRRSARTDTTAQPLTSASKDSARSPGPGNRYLARRACLRTRVRNAVGGLEPQLRCHRLSSPHHRHTKKISIGHLLPPMLTFADLRDSQAADLRRCVLLIMWWNFVGRTDEEIRKAREDWMSSDRFGEVKGYDGDRLPAPEVPATHLKARGRVR
ncbi:hypothetical protein GCM10017562_66180 [Streptomyces roseofulvus]